MFVNFNNSNPSNLSTTNAVGEEGGGGDLSRVQQEGGGLSTTNAVGEEGGEISTRALFEEGGVATTLALNEEGGGGITTLALNEEGGTNQPDRFSTQQILQVGGQADADHNGVLSKDELAAHIKAQEDQLKKIESGEIVFFADPSAQIARMKSDLQAAKFMQKNFDAMAAVDKKDRLSAQDIRTTANRDFRPGDLSQNDVDSLSANNGQNQIHDWILQILQWFQLFLGGGIRF